MKVLGIIIFIISSCISYAQVSDDFKNLAATNKESALAQSVYSENLDGFKYVIENNKEYITNIETWYNYIPNLSTNSFSNFVKVLLDNGMDINESGKSLILAVSKSYDSHHRPKFGTSEIIGVPDSKYKIETLINLGANINIQDNDGNGILHYILSRDNIGTEVNVKLFKKDELGKKEHRGILKSFDKDKIVLEVEENEVEIERKNIAQIKTVYNW